MWTQELIQKIQQITFQLYDDPSFVSVYAKLCDKGLYEEERDVLRRYVDSNSSVLVLGCGAGRECFPLEEMGCKVTGLDISDNMLSCARKLNKLKKKKVTFIKGDFASIPKHIGTFDIIFYSDSILSHIPSKKNRIQIIRNSAKFLNKNGKLILMMSWLAKKKNPFYHNRIVTLLRFIKRRVIDYPLQEVGDSFYYVDGKKKEYYYFYQLPVEIDKEMAQTGLHCVAQINSAWILQN